MDKNAGEGLLVKSDIGGIRGGQVCPINKAGGGALSSAVITLFL
jgi:hypothetical protein